MLKLTDIVQGEGVCRKMFRQLKDGASGTFGFCTTPFLKPKNNYKTRLSDRNIYESFSDVGEIRVWWRANFQSGYRVL